MEDCIEWQRAVTRAGYGVKRIGNKSFYAHRLAYCADRGIDLSTIDDKEVLHTCDNPKCVNPAHLRLGTHAENMADMAAKGRQPRGEARSLAKLTTADVREIRAAYDRGERHPRAMALRYGVNRYTIIKIAKRKMWTWLE